MSLLARLGHMISDPNHPALVEGTPEGQRQAKEEWRRAQHTHAVVNSDRTEIPRKELVNAHAGLLEHEPSGEWWRVWGGDPVWAGDDVAAYFIAADGFAVLLERAGSRHEADQYRASRDARRAAQQAAAKARNKARRKARR